MTTYVPGLEGIPATRSSVSFIDGEKGVLAYRGYPIAVLAEKSSFEETAWLLLEGRLPLKHELTEFSDHLRQHRHLEPPILKMIDSLPRAGHPMKMLQTAVAGLGMFYEEHGAPKSVVGSNGGESLKILACMPTMVAAWESIRNGRKPIAPYAKFSFAENFLYMFTGQEPDPALAQIFDTCLILHAEHTINASTFAALVTGSTLASSDSVISAAIGTLSGPLHGGANQNVLKMLNEIGSPEKVKHWLDKKLSNKEIIWGFGHREYNVKDPRATILQGLVEKLTKSKGKEISPLFETAMALEVAVEERLAEKGVYANVDFYSGILYAEMGFPVDQFTSIFAVSRTVGWLAHWAEQCANNRIFRPTQLYAGALDCQYVLLEDRK